VSPRSPRLSSAVSTIEADNPDFQRSDEYAAPMFGLSLVFVVLLAALIVVWVDIPRVAELSALAVETSAESSGVDDAKTQDMTAQSSLLVERTDNFGKGLQLALFVIWPLFWLEYLVSRWRGNSRDQPKALSRGGAIRLLACLLPPLRLAAPVTAMNGKVWLPKLGWRVPGKVLSKKLERMFSGPMLIIAMLILPILLIEFGMRGFVESHTWLRFTLHIATGFIWCAFTIEFIIMVSVAEKKIAYIKKNWIDLAIILLPLISFLRTVRILRLAKFAKVQKLAKMGRIYRMRGLMTKVLRALMLLDFINRLLRITPEKQLAKLQEEYEEKAEELEELQQEIDEVELSILASRDGASG